MGDYAEVSWEIIDGTTNIIVIGKSKRVRKSDVRAAVEESYRAELWRREFGGKSLTREEWRARN